MKLLTFTTWPLSFNFFNDPEDQGFDFVYIFKNTYKIKDLIDKNISSSFIESHYQSFDKMKWQTE